MLDIKFRILEDIFWDLIVDNIITKGELLLSKEKIDIDKIKYLLGNNYQLSAWISSFHRHIFPIGEYIYNGDDLLSILDSTLRLIGEITSTHSGEEFILKTEKYIAGTYPISLIVVREIPFGQSKQLLKEFLNVKEFRTGDERLDDFIKGNRRFRKELQPPKSILEIKDLKTILSDDTWIWLTKDITGLGVLIDNRTLDMEKIGSAEMLIIIIDKLEKEFKLSESIIDARNFLNNMKDILISGSKEIEKERTFLLETFPFDALISKPGLWSGIKLDNMTIGKYALLRIYFETLSKKY